MATVCPECDGHGVLPSGKFSPRCERECDVCDGAGAVDPEDVDE